MVASLRKPVVDAFTDTFRSAIVPAFEAAAQTMLQQLSSVLQVPHHTTPPPSLLRRPNPCCMCGCYSVAWKHERSARQQRQRGWPLRHKQPRRPCSERRLQQRSWQPRSGPQQQRLRAYMQPLMPRQQQRQQLVQQRSRPRQQPLLWHHSHRRWQQQWRLLQLQPTRRL